MRTAAVPAHRRRPGGAARPYGQPLFARRDAGAWTVPKGEYEPDETAWDAARREFQEELGLPPPDGEAVPLGEVTQKNGKVVTAWAIEADLDPALVVPGTFEREWPPKSGRRRSFRAGPGGVVRPGPGRGADRAGAGGVSRAAGGALGLRTPSALRRTAPRGRVGKQARGTARFRRSAMPIATVNPANGETLKTYDALGAEEIERRLATAETTFRDYRTTSFAERARLLHGRPTSSTRSGTTSAG